MKLKAERSKVGDCAMHHMMVGPGTLSRVSYPDHKLREHWPPVSLDPSSSIAVLETLHLSISLFAII